MVVTHRAIRQDPRRLGEPALPGPAQARDRYSAALLAQIQARHRGEEGFRWPLLAGMAGLAVDLASLTDDRRAIAALLDEHLTDIEQQVFPALLRYLPAGAYRLAEQQIWQNATAADCRFAAPWLARHAKPGELPRLGSAHWAENSHCPGRTRPCATPKTMPRYCRWTQYRRAPSGGGRCCRWSRWTKCPC